MAQTLLSFDSESPGIINDAQYDFYGKRLAVGTSEGKICIFDNSDDEMSKKTSEFSAHDNSIWELTWSHARFGSLIASCGFDRKIIIWKETNNRWDKIYEYIEHKNSVNCVAFANQEFGLILLAGSSDGNISLHEYKNDNWHVVKFHAHSFGVNSVSWAPSKDHLRFVSCGSDNLIKIWRIKENNHGYDIDSIYTESTLDSHEDIVRFVSWRPIKDSNYDVIASGGDDKTALLWIAENKGENAQLDKIEDNPSNWKKYDLKSFDNNIVKITWSLDGESLGVTTQDGVSYIFREISENEWSLISYTNTENNMESADKDN